MNIIILKRVQKQLDKMDAKTRKRIIEGLYGLMEIPPVGDISKIQGEVKKYRLRIGDYRILFALNNEDITIYDVGPRGDIYK